MFYGCFTAAKHPKYSAIPGQVRGKRRFPLTCPPLNLPGGGMGNRRTTAVAHATPWPGGVENKFANNIVLTLISLKNKAGLYSPLLVRGDDGI